VSDPTHPAPPATQSTAPTPPPDLPATLAQLRDAGHTYRTVKQEIRANLVAALSAGEDPFPGIVGFDDTVRPSSSARCSPATTSCCSASAARARPA